MIKHALITIVFGSLAFSTQVVLAQQFNGGIPAGWTCIGTCGTSGTDGVVELSPVPTSTRYGWISTDQGIDGISPFSPTASPFGGNSNGSTLTSGSIHANAGDQLNFYFNYITSDGGDFTDYSWSRLLNADNSSLAAVLFTARTDPAALYIPGQGLPPSEATLTRGGIPVFSYNPILDGGDGTGPGWTPLGPDSGSCWGAGCGYTGWVQASYTIAATGAYQLEFGVTNWIDGAWNSGLAIDGITISPGNVTSAVPEPETYAMLLAGLGLLGFAARRRKQNQL
ncbi:MAG: hypothetical protein FD134_1118 [Gallionellaceae bacterium]|nr:MAG: hypothetical protein FD134_1118 [Gallionellaceae bacterium]